MKYKIGDKVIVPLNYNFEIISLDEFIEMITKNDFDFFDASNYENAIDKIDDQKYSFKPFYNARMYFTDKDIISRDELNNIVKEKFKNKIIIKEQVMAKVKEAQILIQDAVNIHLAGTNTNPVDSFSNDIKDAFINIIAQGGWNTSSLSC